MNYTDKVVIVTGGTKGIGKGCVQTFASAGAKVVFCARHASEGDELARRVNEHGPGEALFMTCDVSKPDQIESLVNEAVARYGQLDCLVNNAGWHPPHQPIDDFTPQDFLDLLQLNVISVFAGCKYALPHLRKTKGNIINLSSLVGVMGQLYASTYVATKGAITSLTKARAVQEDAVECRGRGE